MAEKLLEENEMTVNSFLVICFFFAAVGGAAVLHRIKLCNMTQLI